MIKKRNEFDIAVTESEGIRKISKFDLFDYDSINIHFMLECEIELICIYLFSMIDEA